MYMVHRTRLLNVFFDPPYCREISLFIKRKTICKPIFYFVLYNKLHNLTRDVHPYTSRKSAYVINMETTYDMIL